MKSLAVVWYRSDLRTHDHPALTFAAQTHEHVIPLFVLDSRFKKTQSTKRFHFLVACLQQLDNELQQLGSYLTVQTGRAEQVVPAFARAVDAQTVYWTSDVSPLARQRDQNVTAALRRQAIEARPQSGNYVVDVSGLETNAGKPFVVFTPFWKKWQSAPRRELAIKPPHISTPKSSKPGGEILADMKSTVSLSFPAGEAAARKRLMQWVQHGAETYNATRDLPGETGTSLLSPYLRWGCISPREAETVALGGDSDGSAWIRQLCWRDFYAHILLFFPHTLQTEFQERYRLLTWENNEEDLHAWQQGQTGYPLVDAGMRQLAATGWMHNRVRMVVGSFLTKTLHIDWRFGERWFADQLLDFDPAQNSGNWQWIASVGVDPAPYFQRMFNPVLQQQKFDADGTYVRRWIPELANVPVKHLAEPWEMSAQQQKESGCKIGHDYPLAIVDHRVERQHAMSRYRAVSAR